MANVLETIWDIKQFLSAIKGETLYLVGAGELGQIIGECLDKEKVIYEGYIDGSKEGILNGKHIFRYEECTDADKVIYLITSPQYSNSMSNKLKELGAREIYAVASNRLVYEFYSQYNSMMHQWIDGAYRECSFGEKDPDKTYMVLERTMIYEGIFSNARRFLMGMDYADKMGYVPVIDQIYYPAFEYQDYKNIGYDNPWEYFYEQPSGIGVEYVTSGCKNVRYYNMDDTINIKYLSAPIAMTSTGLENIDRWHYLADKYIHLKKDIVDQIEIEKKQLFPKNARILGTKFRELMIANIIKKCNRGALPIQPEIENQISDIKRKMQEWNCDYIYLMCETDDVLNRMKQEFGEQLIYCERKRTKMENAVTTTQFRYDLLHNTTMDKIKKNTEYLIETYLLVACDALISGSNGAAEMACIIKGGYDNLKFYNFGYTQNFVS